MDSGQRADAMLCDILIRGGEVIDPSQGVRGVRDLSLIHI